MQTDERLSDRAGDGLLREGEEAACLLLPGGLSLAKAKLGSAGSKGRVSRVEASVKGRARWSAASHSVRELGAMEGTLTEACYPQI